MNSKIWFAFCSVFLIFNLKLLIDDYDLVNYMIVDENDKLYDNSNEFLLCILFKNIRANDKLNLQINRTISAFKLINYTIKSIEFNLKTSNLFKLNQTFILRELICFLVNKEQLEIDRPLNGLLEYYPFLYLFPSFKTKQPIFCDYIYLKGSSDLHFNNLKIKKQKIYDHNYLKNPSCLNNLDKLTTNRINCINECLDLINKKYGFYNYLDNYHEFKSNLLINKKYKRELNRIKLNHSFKYINISKYNKFIKCLNNCDHNYCNYETYNVLNSIQNPLKTSSNKIIDLKLSIYLAYYLIDDFWLQLIGLICLITSNCLYNLIIYFNYLLLNQLKFLFQIRIDNKLIKFFIYYYRKYLKFINLKFIFLIFFLLIIFIQTLFKIKEYNYKFKYPNRTSFLNYSISPPSLILCFPVQLLVFNDFKFNNNILLDYTYDELENKSNFNQSKLINQIEFVYGNRIKSSNEFNWKINNNEIYFKRNKINYLNHNYLSRCFRIELEYSNKLRYEFLNPIYYLEIKFKTIYWNLFIIDKNQNFTIQSNEIMNGYSFKKIEIFKKLNCNNSNDRIIKINRCINKRFIKQFNSLSIYSLIDKNDLIKLNLSIENLKFNLNKTNYNKIETDCRNKFNHLIDCKQIKYEETFKLTQSYNNYSIRINLNYENYYEYEFEQSLTKLFLDILNLISITLGISVIGLLKFLTKKIIKFEFIKIIIILICSIGFFIHNIFIFNDIINEDLSHSLHFENLPNYRMPTILICIDLDHQIKIDENYQFTSNYLNKITEKFNLDKIFSKIGYFNKTHYNLFKPNGNNNLNEQISIDTLYFLNFKCFEFSLKILFNNYDLYLAHSKYFLEIRFKKKFINNSKLIYVLYRHPDSNQFSDLLKYKIELVEYKKFENLFSVYEIVFNLIEIDKEDNFESLKNPLSLLYGNVNLNDATNYLNNMRDNFKELTNLTTREIMLENKNFNLEIEENLFQQYYLQIQNYTDHNYPISFNLKQYYYDSQTGSAFFSKPYLVFSISSRIKKIKITNESNFAKLVLNLLNLISFWFDICILDLYNYINNPFKFLIKFYYFLIRLEIKLNNVSSQIILDW